MNWQKKLTMTALVSSLVTLLVVCLLGVFISGTDGALGSLTGGAVVLVFFFSGQLISTFSLTRCNLGFGFSVTMIGLVLRFVFVGISFWAVGRYLNIEPIWLVIGALATLISWLTGLLIGHSRARIPVYDAPYKAKRDVAVACGQTSGGDTPR